MVTKGDILAGAPTFQWMAHNAHPMLLLWCFSMPHERKISYIYIATLLRVLILKFKMCVFNSFVLLYVSLILYIWYHMIRTILDMYQNVSYHYQIPFLLWGPGCARLTRSWLSNAGGHSGSSTIVYSERVVSEKTTDNLSNVLIKRGRLVPRFWKESFTSRMTVCCCFVVFCGQSSPLQGQTFRGTFVWSCFTPERWGDQDGHQKSWWGWQSSHAEDLVTFFRWKEGWYAVCQEKTLSLFWLKSHKAIHQNRNKMKQQDTQL